MTELSIEINSEGLHWLAGEQVFIVKKDGHTDQTGAYWWTETDHDDEVEDRVEDASRLAYEEGYDQAKEWLREEDRRRDCLLGDLIELMGYDAIRQAAALELRSTAIKQELSRRGVL